MRKLGESRQKNKGFEMKQTFMILVLVALAMSITAGSVMAGKKGTDLPFKGNGVGTSDLTVDSNPFETESTGTLIASHLGKGSYTSISTQTWGANDGRCDGPAIGIVDTLVTITAANGDSFDAQSDLALSFLCDISPGGSPLTEYESFTTYDIVPNSGTGKFANASGTFTSHTIHIRPDSNQPSDDVGSWKGTISYNN